MIVIPLMTGTIIIINHLKYFQYKIFEFFFKRKTQNNQYFINFKTILNMNQKCQAERFRINESHQVAQNNSRESEDLLNLNLELNQSRRNFQIEHQNRSAQREPSLYQKLQIKIPAKSVEEFSRKELLQVTQVYLKQLKNNRALIFGNPFDLINALRNEVLQQENTIKNLQQALRIQKEKVRLQKIQSAKAHEITGQQKKHLDQREEKLRQKILAHCIQNKQNKKKLAEKQYQNIDLEKQLVDLTKINHNLMNENNKLTLYNTELTRNINEFNQERERSMNEMKTEKRVDSFHNSFQIRQKRMGMDQKQKQVEGKQFFKNDNRPIFDSIVIVDHSFKQEGSWESNVIRQINSLSQRFQIYEIKEAELNSLRQNLQQKPEIINLILQKLTQLKQKIQRIVNKQNSGRSEIKQSYIRLKH